MVVGGVKSDFCDLLLTKWNINLCFWPGLSRWCKTITAYWRRGQLLTACTTAAPAKSKMANRGLQTSRRSQERGLSLILGCSDQNWKIRFFIWALLLWEKYMTQEKKRETSQTEQGHTRVPSSPSSIWTQIIQQSSNLLGSLLLRPFSSKKSWVLTKFGTQGINCESQI